jgi:hypothetical protein
MGIRERGMGIKGRRGKEVEGRGNGGVVNQEL